MMLCDTGHSLVMNEKLVDAKNFVANHDELFDLICMGCTDINRPLIDDMAGSGESPGRSQTTRCLQQGAK